MPMFKITYNAIISYEEHRSCEVEADDHESAETAFDALEIDDSEEVDREFVSCEQCSDDFDDPNQIKMEFEDE